MNLIQTFIHFSFFIKIQFKSWFIILFSNKIQLKNSFKILKLAVLYSIQWNIHSIRKQGYRTGLICAMNSWLFLDVAEPVLMVIFLARWNGRLPSPCKSQKCNLWQLLWPGLPSFHLHETTKSCLTTFISYTIYIWRNLCHEFLPDACWCLLLNQSPKMHRWHFELTAWWHETH